jgi:cyclic pyranopterin phosphate synthase
METHGTSPQLVANFKMIDVGQKMDTRRRALASGHFFARKETIRQIVEKKIPKGDAIALAEVAGIQAAKNTASLLPLCHPLPLHSVRVWTELKEDSIIVFCEAITTGKTGVEMEALTGVSTALLCIYDLTKVIDPVLRIGNIQLELKEGGKSGLWENPHRNQSRDIPEIAPMAAIVPATSLCSHSQDFGKMRVCLLTVSDRCSRGESEDRSGPVMQDWFGAKGAEILARSIVPDEVAEIEMTIENWMKNERPHLIISSGGTGLAPRDVTPDALLRLKDRFRGREISGVGELLRSSGSQKTVMSWLSRSLGLQILDSIIIALPGSPKAVREGLDVLAPLLAHMIHIQKGGDHVRENRTV